MTPAAAPAGAPSALEGMFPGYFALVMATGIVSISAHFLGFDGTSRALFWANVFFYAVLWILTGARLVRHRRAFVGDLTSHARSVLFLTMVAATCVLGSQFAMLTPWIGVARALWFAGLLLWAVLIAVFFTVVTLRERSPTSPRGSTERGCWWSSRRVTAVLGTLVAPTFARPDSRIFPGPLRLPRRVHAVPVLHRAHLLPLDVLRMDSGRVDAELLDQHGRRRDHDAGRGAPASVPGSVAFPRGHRPVSQGLHVVLLGGRRVVDPAARDRGRLETRRAARAADLSPAVLVARVSPRHVHGFHVRVREGHRSRVSHGDTEALPMGRTGGLARHVRRDVAGARPARESSPGLPSRLADRN